MSKKSKKVQEQQQKQVSKQEKEMFSLANRAHGPRGSTIDWGIIKSLWNI